jgi:hypothetical protein
MKNIVAFVLFFVPLLGFVSAAMLEFQRDRRSLRALSRSLPLALATIFSVLLPIDIVHPYFSFHDLSVWIAAFALLVPACALACRYKSRVAATLIFLAGLLLAFFWYLNRFVAVFHSI